jgi:26S proteasome regulatory subunit N2
MTKDPTDFVRQGALVSLAMILVQHSEAQSPKAKAVRELFEKTVSDKHEDSLAKFGAAIAQGIIDAGGRNATISLRTKAGTPNMTAIVGMTLFSQFWYWFPLAHCLSLSFIPTGIIGLDENLKVCLDVWPGLIKDLTSCPFQMPKLEFTSNAKPSLFAYPAPYTPPKKETVEKVKTAVLSTTARANARAKAREQEKSAAEGDAMDTVSKGFNQALDVDVC